MNLAWQNSQHNEESELSPCYMNNMLWNSCMTNHPKAPRKEPISTKAHEHVVYIYQLPLKEVTNLKIRTETYDT